MSRERGTGVAVVGVSGRFPGAPDVGSLWEAVAEGRVLTTRLDRAELAAAGEAEALLADPGYVPARGLLADADRFDADLFRISARDAELMDPQHRLMLEAAWCAIEDAGLDPVGAGGRVTSVYASDSGSAYLRAMLAAGPLDPQTLDQAIHGGEPDFIASLISYKLDLTGPALGVRTACSSSLVGLHLAVRALLSGECDQALVVAAGIDFPQAGYLHVPGGIQSASGACRPFSQDSDGVVAGSGAAAVLLRRLADAGEECAPPYGVILGTAVNNDGAAKAGYYAPSAEGQEAVIRSALAAADVPARSVGYLETHGTGTRIGDPIEWSAASAAYGELGAAPGQIAIGALKANTGHLDAAAGLAALIKALLVVRDGTVPPVAGLAAPNPLLETEGSPLRIPTAREPWTGPLPRRAAISSFGVGGTNAHVIVEQPPSRVIEEDAEPAPAPDSPRLLLLSAADSAALDRSASRLAAHLSGRPGHGESAAPDLADVAHTLAAGRAALSERLALVAEDPAAAVRRLTSGDGVIRGTGSVEGAAPVVLLLPGQGAQYPGMALPLRAALPGFDEALEDCFAALGPDSAALVRPALLDPAFPTDRLRETDLAQPALFALEHAAATALSWLGVTPSALIGHSLGEITAACLAGVFELGDAARFVIARGRAMAACPPGAMLALGCGERAALRFAAESGYAVELTAVNGAESCVLGGRHEQISAFREWLGDRVFARVLRTSHAFHSALIEPALPELAEALADAKLREPLLPFASNLSGRLIAPGESIEPKLFVQQARRPVRFAEALAEAVQLLPGALAVEAGPGRVLTGLAAAAGLPAIALSPARGPRPESEVLAALGELWTRGQPLDVAELCAEGVRARIPGYPFFGPRRSAPELRLRQPAAEQRIEPAKAEAPAVSATPAARTETAEADVPAVLARLWGEVLGRPGLEPDADFFDLGGDSLLITQLARSVHAALGVRVPLRDMLVARTLQRQTAIVADLLTGAAPGREL